MTIPKDPVAQRSDDEPSDDKQSIASTSTSETFVTPSTTHPANLATEPPVISPKTKKMVRFGDESDEKSTSSSSQPSSQDEETQENMERRLAMSANKVMCKQALQKAQSLLKKSASTSRPRVRRRKSPPPANMSSAEEIKYQLDRMELKIQKAAKMELALLNQSKKLRDQRTAYQRRYEKLAGDYRELVQKSHPENAVVEPTFALPPVFPAPGASGVVDLTMEE